MKQHTLIYLINNSGEDLSDYQILLYHKDPHNESDQAIAWRVIENLKNDDEFLIEYPGEFNLELGDNEGLPYAKETAYAGMTFEITSRRSRKDLKDITDLFADSNGQINFSNDLKRSSAFVNIYKDSRIFARVNNILPGQSTEFHINPNINLALANNISEGDILVMEDMLPVKAEFDISNARSADIVIKKEGDSYSFSLRNLKRK